MALGRKDRGQLGSQNGKNQPLEQLNKVQATGEVVSDFVEREVKNVSFVEFLIKTFGEYPQILQFTVFSDSVYDYIIRNEIKKGDYVKVTGSIKGNVLDNGSVICNLTTYKVEKV